MAHVNIYAAQVCIAIGMYQSVSKTADVWPLNKGILSGSLPVSARGITAKAPPPLASQLTERYFGFTWRVCQSSDRLSSKRGDSTLTKLVSHAFFEIWRLS